MLAVGGWLLLAGSLAHWLLSVGGWRLVADWLLLVAGGRQLAAGCWLVIAGCWLLAVAGRFVNGCWLGYLRLRLGGHWVQMARGFPQDVPSSRPLCFPRVPSGPACCSKALP